MNIYLADAAAQNLNDAADGLNIFLGADAPSPTTSTILYASNEINRLNKDIRLRCLLSYHYYKKVDISKIFSPDIPQPLIMADSGAFSALSLGVPIDIYDYANWIKKWDKYFYKYPNLDVIGDPKKTLDNQHLLEAEGLKPMPVFHVNEPWEYLEHYLDKYDYVALGGIVPYSQRLSILIPWLIKAFKMLPEGKKYHGFGVTGWKVLCSFPWDSVDSSSWAAGYRYGRIPLFSPVEGKIVAAVLGDPVSCFKYKNLFDYVGYNWKDFAYRKEGEPLSGQRRKEVAGVSAITYLRVEQWLRKRHQKK